MAAMAGTLLDDLRAVCVDNSVVSSSVQQKSTEESTHSVLAMHPALLHVTAYPSSFLREILKIFSWTENQKPGKGSGCRTEVESLAKVVIRTEIAKDTEEACMSECECCRRMKKNGMKIPEL